MQAGKLVGPYMNGSTGYSSCHAKNDLAGAYRRGFRNAELAVCDPHGAEEKKLDHLLARIEPQLRDISGTDTRVKAIVGEIDKSRQNPLNQLGGREALGQKAMELYWDTAQEAVGAFSAMNDGAAAHLARVAPRSDEGIIIIAGTKVGLQTEVQFKEAWDTARAGKRLADYRCAVELKDGSQTRLFELDLDGFSRILNYPEMVTACKCSLSRPILISPDSRRGFLSEEIRTLENSEVAFYRELPECFRGHGAISEVSSPFRESLLNSNIERMKSGTFVEIKLGMPETAAMALLDFTVDGPGWKGTKKGFAEIFSRNIGMRGLNTFLAKARSNRILTPVVQAMWGINEKLGIKVVPVNGAYLQYWIDRQQNDGAEDIVRRAIERRINNPKRTGLDLDLAFKPIVSALDASETKLAEVRARFILASMGKDLYDASVLDNTDFLLNFLENVSPVVQRGIFDQLSLGRKIELYHLDNLGKVKRVMLDRLKGRHTIRDTEDFVWVLREDGRLPKDIRSKRSELERWLFQFALDHVDKIKLLLAHVIEDKMRERECKKLRVVG